MSIEPSGERTARLPRRVGFMVRWRARSGLLPGRVSTAALVQARRYRWVAWLIAPIIVVIATVIIATSGTSFTDEPGVVKDVLHVTPSSTTRGRLEVVVDNGRTVFFDNDPGVHKGDHVVVRIADNGPDVGLVVNGAYIPSSSNYYRGPSPVLVGLIYLTLLLVVVGPPSVWGRRAYKQIKKDIDSPLSEARGRYLGSWVWRGLSNRFLGTLRHRSLGHVTGFPIAVEERPGEVTWFGASVDMLGEIRHFEDTIASGTRQVLVTYHPNSHAIARLDAADGSASIDLQHVIDHLHPESGLQLKVSRRRRKAHLPDF